MQGGRGVRSASVISEFLEEGIQDLLQLTIAGRHTRQRGIDTAVPTVPQNSRYFGSRVTIVPTAQVGGDGPADIITAGAARPALAGHAKLGGHHLDDVLQGRARQAAKLWNLGVRRPAAEQPPNPLNKTLRANNEPAGGVLPRTLRRRGNAGDPTRSNQPRQRLMTSAGLTPRFPHPTGRDNV